MVKYPEKPELCKWLITFPPDNFCPGILISSSKPTQWTVLLTQCSEILPSFWCSASRTGDFVFKKKQHLNLDQPVRLPIKQINSKNKNLLSESVVLTFQYAHSINTARFLLVHADISWILSYLTAICQVQRIFTFDMWHFVQWTEKEWSRNGLLCLSWLNIYRGCFISMEVRSWFVLCAGRD